MTTEVTEQDRQQAPTSLGTAAARNLATTTKTIPQMQTISSRWLLRVLPWVEVAGGTYRVNRRLTYDLVDDGALTFITTGRHVRVIPEELRELAPLRGFADTAVLEALAGRCEQREFSAGDVIATAGSAADRVFLIAHGKVVKTAAGAYGDPMELGVLAGGEYFGAHALTGDAPVWEYTATAATGCTVLVLTRAVFDEVAGGSARLREQILAYRNAPRRPQNKKGEAAIHVASGHSGEPDLPGTFADYELTPREYELSVAQTALRVHTRVADLYNHPMDQIEQQLRLTIEALRERQEYELVNNPHFGLLNNAAAQQRIPTRWGPPTPDDLDELITRRRSSRVLLAHPRAIAAFLRECTRAGIYPLPTEIEGRKVPAWRGVPLLPCNKIPVSDTGMSSILVMRTGEEDQGVVGLRQTGIPDEVEPGLSVRFMGVDKRAIISYLVTAYFSAAVLVPDALGVLHDVDTKPRAAAPERLRAPGGICCRKLCR